MSVTRRLRWSFLAAAAIILVVSAVTLVGSLQWSAIASGVAASRDLLSELDLTLASVTEAETGQRGYILTGDPLYLTGYRTGTEQVNRLLYKLEAREREFPSLHAAFSELKPLIHAKMAELDETVTLRRTRGFAEADAVVLQGNGRLLMDRIRFLISDLRATQEKILAARQSAMRITRVLAAGASITGSLLAVLILVVSGRRALGSEKAARHAQQRFDAFMRHNPSVIFIKDAAGRLAFMNAAFAKLFQIDSSTWIGKNDFEIWPADVARKLREADVDVLAGSQSVELIERIPIPGGEIREFLSVKFPFRLQEDDLYLGGIAFDVTESRARTAALKESEEFNRSILRSSSDCIKVLDLDGAILSMNENGMLLMNVPGLHAVIGKDWTAFWQGDDRRAATEAVAAARNGASSSFEGFCPTFNGTERWWDVVVSPMRNEAGETVKLLAVSRNITERKFVEARLRRSELRYRELFEQNPLPAWIYDNETLRFLDVNQTAIDRYGYSFGEFLRMRISDIRLPEEHQRIEDDLRSNSGGRTRSGPWRHRLKNGSQLTVELTTREIGWAETPARLVMVHDITERVESEHKFRCLFERSGDAILLTCGGVVEDCNPAAVKLLGARTKDQVLGMTAPELLAERQPDGRRADWLAAAMREESAKKGSLRMDLVHRKLNGEEFLVDLSMTAVEIQGKQMRLVMWHDLTERQRAEEALRASEARFNAFMENSPALAFIKDREGRMLYMNRICQRMWNLDRIDWQGKSDAELWSPELARQFRKLDLAVLDSDTAGSNVEVVPLPGGGTCSLLSYKFPLRIQGGDRLIGGVSLDISEQIQAERIALEALADKDVLLKEVHHRVKNNLQVICSLLGMQAASLADPEAIAALRESQDRVQSMAVIHELLYGSKTLDDINFAEYAELLLGELTASYRIGNRVRMRIDVAPIHFSIDQAIPCGLILNELISNSLKYAFPGNREGEILVSLLPCGEDRIAFAVQDDGVGLPHGLKVENSQSLGLRIVQILAKQLEGTLAVESRAGFTSFQVIFPNEARDRAGLLNRA